MVDRVQMWRDRIIKLLTQHHISLFDGHHELWVIMRAEHDNRVHWTIFGKQVKKV